MYHLQFIRAQHVPACTARLRDVTHDTSLQQAYPKLTLADCKKLNWPVTKTDERKLSVLEGRI